MITKDDKAEINKTLVQHGIKNKRQIFNMINQGATLDDVHAAIQQMVAEIESARKPHIFLRNSPQDFTIFGESLIAQNAIDDMNAVMRLPYVTAGALMPDGHRVQENHVPVGGVVVSDDVLPGVVGSDISCSVLLTVTTQKINDKWFDDNRPSLAHVLKEYTFFGAAMNTGGHPFHNTLDVFRPLGQMETSTGRELLQSIQAMAQTQFGTSGDGNHFVEWGAANIERRGSTFGNTGDTRYLAILSHFGSRGIGALIAKVFSKLAEKSYEMPKGMTDAPLSLSTPLGRDYWKLMTFAGDFAEAGHLWLHRRLLDQLDRRVNLEFSDLSSIYSRHNFAWESPDGIVHRKGATPAAFGEHGVIPATMGHESKVIVGRGNLDSFSSASHGAGRTHSRGAALQSFGGVNTADYVMKNHDILLIGGGADEDPRAYKNIDTVMKAQEECVWEIGGFQPKVVRMADPRFSWGKRKKDKKGKG